MSSGLQLCPGRGASPPHPTPGEPRREEGGTCPVQWVPGPQMEQKARAAAALSSLPLGEGWGRGEDTGGKTLRTSGYVDIVCVCVCKARGRRSQRD